MQGEDDERVRKETGWHTGMEGKLRFEIDDSKMKYHRGGDAAFSRNRPDYAEYQKLVDKMLTGSAEAWKPEDQERLDTLDKVRDAGIKVCSGGIVGLGETVKDRAGLLLQLANLPTPPESVPINMLVKVKGTPLADNDDVDAFDFIRTIAIARIMMPTSHVRLSAGREQMNEQTQAMCFMAGANSIFYGCKLLTTPNPEEDKDLQLFRKLGINPQQTEVLEGDNAQQQRLEQALMNPDTEEYYNAAAL